MNVGSVCSGDGFMDLGFHRAGHRTVWFCESDPYRRRVLVRHWLGVPIFPDLTELDPADLEPVDILIGGTPCPAWSSAGRRAGFADPRARLFWDFVRVRDALRPRWTVWENVPGVFSQHRGRDFALVLEALVGARVAVPSGGWDGAGVAVGPVGTAAWRVLNAQWFGVPQRRRRVFVVADFGGVLAPEVLFECPGSSGDLAPGGEAGPDVARCFGASVAGTLGAHKSGGTDPTDLERGGGVLVELSGRWTERGGGVDDNDARAGHLVVAGTQRSHSRPGSNHVDLVVREREPMVRRLTPTERERLMGAPDGWTYDWGPSLLDAPMGLPRENACAVDYPPDGPRESASGDGVVVQCAEWIGRRISMTEALR